MSEPETPEEPEPAAKGAVGEALGHYVRDPALWPVLAVLVLVAATLGAAIVLFALVDRNVPAMGALALLVGMSVHAIFEDLRQSRFGMGCRVILFLWVAVAVVAVSFHRLGVF